MTTPFPKSIFQTWKTKTNLPSPFEYWSNTWKQLNPSYEYTLWDDADNRKFLETHYSWFLPRYDSYDVNIKRVDAVRYFYLFHYGGIYADMDFECLKPLDQLLIDYSEYDILLGSMETGNDWKQDHSIPNAIMISKPKARFWEHVIVNLNENKTNDISTENQTGPIFLKNCLADYTLKSTHAYKSKIHVFEPSIFYPISWAKDEHQIKYRLPVVQGGQLFTDSQKLFPESYAVTYWTHTW